MPFFDDEPSLFSDEPSSLESWLIAADEFEGESRDAITSRIRKAGTEASGWYQSHHIWSEETWGIYLDADAIEAFAFRQLVPALMDRKLFRIRLDPRKLLARMVFYHEWFHATVDAALTWLEFIKEKPLHETYKKEVYRRLKFSEHWLEEALANWSALAKSNEELLHLSVPDSDRLGILAALEELCDMSPEGYRHWRKGADPISWRKLANQLSSGRWTERTRSPQEPIEGLLREAFPFSFLPHEVPLHIVGDGPLAQDLDAQRLPSRRSVEKFLRGKKCTFQPGRGKGSHEMWQHPSSGLPFILPRRDPLGREVYNNFLKFIGEWKEEYFGLRKGSR